MGTPPLSFRDVVAGASTEPPSQLKDITPSEFVEQVALFQPNLNYAQQGAVGQWLMQQYLKDQTQHLIERTSYYEELGLLQTIDPGRSKKTWSPSNWMFEDSASDTALEEKWEEYESNPNLHEESPWKSEDFLSKFFGAGGNQRRTFSIPPETVAAGPPTSTQQPRSKPSIWSVPTEPGEKAVKLLPPPQMTINIASKQLVNFTRSAIQFQVEVENIPAKLSVGSDMIEANAFGPGGERCRCTIRKEVRKANTLSFAGHFRTKEETGFYVLQARLIIPNKFWRYARNGAIVGKATVFISKNYLVDSLCCYSFECASKPTTYGVPSPMENLAYSKAWGLSCNTMTNHLYYSDRATDQIYCVDTEGRIISSFGQPTTPGMVGVNCPTGLAFDPIHRRLVVVDKDHHRICLFTLGGQFIDSFGSPGHGNGEFNYPWDVAVSPVDGKIAVTDSKNKRLQLFGGCGEFLGKYSVFEKTPLDYKTQLDFPRGCSFDAEGKYLYATDFNVQNVLELTTDMLTCRKVIPDVEKTLRRPQGITVDNHGNLLVADSMNDSIRFMSREGDLLCSIFSVSNRPLGFPVNLTILAGGKLVVLDGKGNIHIF